MKMSRKCRAYNLEFRKQRIKAIERDEGLCVLCGRLASDVHHIVFRSQGGTNAETNLACLCRDCHELAHGVKAKEVRQRLKELMKT